MSKVAILGTGHSAMLAALAVERMGHEPEVYGRAIQSEVSKTMFYAEPIPGATGSQGWRTVVIEKRGTKEAYANRLYGDWAAECSWDELPSFLVGHPVKPVYDLLWSVYSGGIIPLTVHEEVVHEILKSYSLVISTIPAKAICYKPEIHNFNMVKTQVLRVAGAPNEHMDLMVYNGYEEGYGGSDWFRYSRINGEQVWEYPYDERRPKSPGLSEGFKPVGNDCDCWHNLATSGVSRPQQIHRVGRFAKWRRGVQNHHAFQDTVAILANEGFGRSV